MVDECGGHFGPVDTGEVVYHYHSRTYVPYHMACQGPALGNCAATQRGTSYCHPGCGGYEVCVQPGTSEEDLREYLGQWDPDWLDQYNVNPYQEGSSNAHQYKKEGASNSNNQEPSQREDNVNPYHAPSHKEDNVYEELVKEIKEMFL